MAAAPQSKPGHFVVSGGAEAQNPNADYRAAASPAHEPLVIQWKRAGGGGGVDVIAILTFVGIVVFPWYAGAPRLWVFVGGLVVTPIVLALGLRALKEHMNRTIVTIDDEHLRCDRRPIRLFERSAMFDSKRVSHVWVDWVYDDVRTTEGNEREVVRYDVLVSYESGNGAGMPLVRMAHWEEEEAQFLVETIKRRLGRTD